VKKVYLKNFVIIIVLIASLITGSFDYTVNCVSEECCKTECCEENSLSSDSDFNLILSSSDCCEFVQSFENKIYAAFPHNTKNNISSPSNLNYKISLHSENSYFLLEPLLNPDLEIHSTLILRI